MPKQIDIDGVGPVTFYKRRGARNIKLSITHTGSIRVTLPLWAPYKMGQAFAEQKREWLMSQRPTAQVLAAGAKIGKAHRLIFACHQLNTIATRVGNNEVRITLPLAMLIENPAAQTAARKASVRALKKEAKALLPIRLSDLAQQNRFEYRSVTIKELRGRWGSCSQHKDIVLNCFLMQLSWQLIDYVIFHELVHTRVLAHGKPFWDELAHYVPNLPEVRKTMRQMQPSLRDTQEISNLKLQNSNV